MVFENDNTWLDARIAAAETAIVAIETAIATVSSSNQSYTLDTGQTRQTVTRANLAELQSMLDAQIRLRDTYRARRYGAAFIGRPAT